MLAPAGGYSGYSITNSAITDGSGDYWSRPYSSGDRRTNTFHIGFRVLDPDYRSTLLSAGSVGNGHVLELENSGLGTAKTNSGSSLNLNTSSGKLFRDVGSFYALTIRYDTTQATDSDRVKFWVNGVEGTWTSTFAWPGLNDDMNWSNNVTHCLGSRYSGTNDAKLQFAYFIHQEGIAGDHLTVGEFYNGGTQYRLIDFSGISVGTEGCILDFTNGADLGEDQAGSNDWTTNGSPVQSSDSPTVNYATWNAVDNTSFTLSNGNRTASTTTSDRNVRSTIAIPFDGKSYWEVELDALANSPRCIGLMDQTLTRTSSHTLDANTRYVITRPGHATDGEVWDGSSFSASYDTTTAGDILCFARNGANLWIRNNGDSWWGGGDPAAGTSPTLTNIDEDITWVIAAISASGTGTHTFTLRIGDDEWSQTAPAGFVALSAANLPEVTITDPGEHFNAVAYTGDGTISNAITGVGFQPDFTWLKSRSNTYAHWLNDVIRGAGNGIRSDATDAEYTTLPNLFQSFDSDGFTVGLDYSNNTTNANIATYVAWNWKAGGAGVANTDGTISSTVSVNDDAGFSIVKFTGNGTAGATVGHGQSAAIELLILKCLDTAENWSVGANVIDSAWDNRLRLNATSGRDNSANWFNDTAPASTVFSIGDNGQVNRNLDNYIAYCFRSIPGYSKVFSYTGNGSTDGTFVYLGFKPRWVMIKPSSAVDNWLIWDTERGPYNPNDNPLKPDSSVQEFDPDNNRALDLLSNGLSIKVSHSSINGSGTTYIGIAFAENPFGGSNLPLGLAQ